MHIEDFQTLVHMVNSNLFANTLQQYLLIQWDFQVEDHLYIRQIKPPAPARFQIHIFVLRSRFHW